MNRLYSSTHDVWKNWSTSELQLPHNSMIVYYILILGCLPFHFLGGGPRVVVSTAAFHAGVLGSVPGLGGLKKTKMFLPHPRVKVSIVESLRDREVACSASDRQGSNFESCVWRTVSSHHPQEVFLAQLSLYVHKGGLKPDSFHFHFTHMCFAGKLFAFHWQPWYDGFVLRTFPFSFRIRIRIYKHHSECLSDISPN